MALLGLNSLTATGTNQSLSLSSTGSGTVDVPVTLNITKYGNTLFQWGATYDTYLTYGSTGAVYLRTYNGTSYANRFVIDANGRLTTGLVPFARLEDVPTSLANTVNLTGDQTVAGIKTFSNNVIVTAANNPANGGGQLYLNGSTGNRIDFNTGGVAAPAFTTRSAGTKIVLFPNIDAASVDYALGIENSTLWQSVSSSSAQFKWYGGTTNIATLSGAGALTISSTLSLGIQATTTSHAVRADRSISTGDGLSGGGDLTTNRTFTVDSTVVRTSGNQTIAGIKTFTGSNTFGGVDNPITVYSNNPTFDVWSGGLEIREVNLVGNSNTTNTYAPAITFHWSSVAATAIKMYNDGSIRFKSQNTTETSYRPIYADQFISNVAEGTAPLTVVSTTKVNNLNADLLDGIDSSRIVFGDNATKTTYTSNFNTALASGFYNHDNATGAPSAAWYHLIANRHTNIANNYQMQFAGQFDNVNNLFYRTISNNTPSAWYRIWHSNNGGAGSGLDADLLDGKNTGTSGNTIPLLDGANTWSNTQTFGNISSNFLVLAEGGSEGGQFRLQKPPSSSTLAGNVVFDINSNSVRIFEDGSPWRGVIVDITGCAAQSTLLHTNNYNSYAPTLTGGNASGTWGINISGTAAAATNLNASHSILRVASSASATATADFQNTPAGTTRLMGDHANLTSSPGGTWWFYQNMRHTNGSNYWGTQVAWGWEDNANRLFQRNVTSGTFSAWVEYLNTSQREFAGYLQMAGSLRAPIFYDSNNTGYYTDPASTSILNSLTLNGSLTVGSSTSSDIYMTDTDEGTRRIHCNSNRIGFLTGPGGWGSYCADNGDWTTDTISYAGVSMRSQIFYDTNNTGYYVDPLNTSNLNVVTATTFNGSLNGNASTVNNGVYTNGNATITAAHTYQTSATGMGTSAGGQCRLETIATGGGGAFMSFHRPTASAFATYLGLDTDNVMKVGGWSHGGNVYPVLLGDKSDQDSNLWIRNGSPTIYLRDTNHNTAFIHCNSNIFYILRGGTDATTWDAVGGRWPFEINLTNNNAQFGGGIYMDRDALQISGTRFKVSAVGNDVQSSNIYNNGTTSGANMHVRANDFLIERNTSSIKYKHSVETLNRDVSDYVIKNLRPVWYKSKCANDTPDWSWYGFIAEEVAEIDPRLCHWDAPIIKEETDEYEQPESYTDKDGKVITPDPIKITRKYQDPNASKEVEGVMYERFTVLLVDQVQRLIDRVDSLEEKLKALSEG